VTAVTLRRRAYFGLALFFCSTLPGADLFQTPVFIASESGYHTFRIPAIVATQKGTLLAFAEGRKRGTSDTGDIDLVLKRSLNLGRGWEPLQIVADDGPNTIGNPCPVLDRSTGTVWLPLTRNLGEDSEDEILARTGKGTREVWITKSDDDGVTWSKPIDITAAVKRAEWTWYATGPGCGIQLSAGRLLIPCDHAVEATQVRRSHVIFSDDHGATWRLGGVLDDLTNECQAVELADGAVMLNMRSYHGKNRRAVATSKDGGLTWSAVALDDVLIEPVCQASFLRYSRKTEKKVRSKDRIVFANPASTRREKMTVRLSYDEGKTWPVEQVLHEGPSAYSSLVVLASDDIGCLYERGTKKPYETITYARFNLRWLTDAKDSP